jgi:hypothetical protein
VFELKLNYTKRKISNINGMIKIKCIILTRFKKKCTIIFVKEFETIQKSANRLPSNTKI